MSYKPEEQSIAASDFDLRGATGYDVKLYYSSNEMQVKSGVRQSVLKEVLMG